MKSRNRKRSPRKPFARFWLHSELLNVEAQKMSKSVGNFYTLRDLLGMGYAPEAVRYLLASVPYRKKLNFTFDGLKAAATSIERLRNFKLRLETEKFPEGVESEHCWSERSGRVRALRREPGRRSEHCGGAWRRCSNTFATPTRPWMRANFSPAMCRPRSSSWIEFDSIFDVLRPSASAAGCRTRKWKL